jgi:CRISPR system Cascade subunit CasA
MNLLEDPVFTVRTSDGPETCSLPRIYHLLQQDAVEEFVKLQAHQKQAWHCFLAQLGAIATEDRPMPNSESGWREALSALACQEAWNLYTEDLSKPAFMQPPVPEESIDPFRDSKGKIQEVDVTEYDIPVLSKNHALKLHRITSPSSEHWAYLLVNVQTCESGWGRGKYPTSRMNGGYGSRPFFTTTPSLRIGPWIMHDIQRMHEHVDRIEEEYDYRREITPLLWTVTWDGEQRLDLSDMHPWYIDCCRRIRKSEVWMYAATDDTRVKGVTNGQTGDPWAPINVTENKVLTPSENSFRYRQLCSILFGGDFKRPIGFSDVDNGYIVCRALTPDDTAREYNLERIIRFYNAASDDPFDTPDESQIAEEAKTRIQKAGQAASIFSDALDWLFCEDVEEGPSSGLMSAYKKQNPDEPAKACDRQKNALHSRIDQNFFSRLFNAPDMDDAERYTFWETVLVDALRAQWNDAKHLCPEKDRWERVARAQSVFENRTRSTFTYAKQFANDDEHENTEDGLGQPDRRAVADLQ